MFIYFCKMKIFYSFFFVLCFFNLSNAQTKLQQSNWQQRVNYKIDVNFNPENKTLKGEIQFEYFNNSPDTIKTFYIHAWPNAYKNNQTAFAKQEIQNGKRQFYFSKEEDRGYIDSFAFQINKKSVKWSFDPQHIDILVLELNEWILPNQKVIIQTPFFVKVPKVVSRMGTEDGFFAFTQWFPKPAVYDVNGWNPIPYLDQGEFYSEFGAFEVNITCPKNYIVAATGNLQNPDELAYLKSLNGKKAIRNSKELHTLKYTENNIHDFAWFADTAFYVEDNFVVLNNGDTITTWLFADQDYNKIIKKQRTNSHPILSLNKGVKDYSNAIGNYPYNQCTVVIGALSAGAGMEYPTITICESDEESTIIHEVGHNWFYGILASNERQYPWMDESMNTYFHEIFTNSYHINDQFLEFNKGKDWFSKYQTMFGLINSAQKSETQKLNLPSDQFTNNNYGLIVYGKGPLLFAYLNEQLGDTLFDQCIKNYYETWKFKHPLPKDVQNSFEKTTKMDLSWFFDDLMNENYEVDIQKTDSFRVKGFKNFEAFLNQNKDTKTANRNGLLLENNFKNNGQSMDFINFGIPFKLPLNNAKINMNLSPIIGYNLYDQFYAGAMLFNRTIFRNKFEYNIMPAYSFAKNKLIGFAQLNSLFWRNNGISKFTEFGIIGQQFGTDFNAQSNQYFKINPYFRIHFKHKNPSLYKSNLNLAWTHTGLENQFRTLLDSSNNPIQLENFNFFNYLKLEHIFKFTNAITPTTIRTYAEYGYNYKFGVRNSEYIKIGAELRLKQYLSKDNKYFKTRTFAGIFAHQKGNTGLQNFYVTNAIDYTYQQALIGRNETQFSNNIFGNQIIDNESNIRAVVPMSQSSNWIISSNNEITLPGKIPFNIYFDAAFYQIPVGTSTGIKYSKAELYYVSGLSLPIFEDIFEIYLPVYYSKNININSNQIIALNKIGFKLNLNKLNPYKILGF